MKIVCLFLLLPILSSNDAISSTTSLMNLSLSTTPVPVTVPKGWTQKEVQKAMKAAKMVTQFVKTFSEFVPVVGPYAKHVFAFIEIVIDRQIPDDVIMELEKLSDQLDEMRSNVLREIAEVDNICGGIILAESTLEAGAFFQLLKNALFEKNNTFKMEAFLHACALEPLDGKISMIEKTLRQPETNTLKKALGADRLHRTSTINSTKKRILETINTFVLVEAFRGRYAYKRNSRMQNNTFDDVVRAARSAISLAELIMEECKNLEYFEKKMKDIVDSALIEIGNVEDSVKAKKLLEKLNETHTNDIFVVIIYSSDPNCEPSILHDRAQNSAIDRPDHRLVVYRSRFSHNMSPIDRDSFERAKVNVAFGACNKPNLATIRKELPGVGLVLFDRTSIGVGNCITALELGTGIGKGTPLAASQTNCTEFNNQQIRYIGVRDKVFVFPN